MTMWRSRRGFGAARLTWATYVRGEYPGVSGGLAMIPSRCALRAAWYTPILSERKAQRVFERMKGRMAVLLEQQAEKMDYWQSQKEALLRERDRVVDTKLVVAGRVPCRGSSGCYHPGDNTVYFRRSHFRWVPGSYDVFDPHRQMTHGALVHELAHAAAVTPTKVTRYLAPGPGMTMRPGPIPGSTIISPGPLVEKHKIRRSPHGPRFVQRLAQAVRAWCETEGKPVCEHYCAPGRPR